MIERYRTGKRMSQAVVFNGLIYISGQTADEPLAPIKEQTRQVLEKIDKILEEVGAERKMLLSVNVYLPHITDFDAMNEVYDEWVSPENTPARACVEARLAIPDLRVEIAAIAAKV